MGFGKFKLLLSGKGVRPVVFSVGVFGLMSFIGLAAFLPVTDNFLSTLYSQKEANAQVPINKIPPSFIASVDTMKESLDSLNNRLTPAQIDNTVKLAASMNTTHIAISVPYDNPDYAKLWVDAIRKYNKKVWFRMSWNNWLGVYDAPGTMTPQEFLSSTQSYISNNKALFRSGDIFDICPEPEQGKYWAKTYGDSWNWQAETAPARAQYNAFIRDGSLQSAATFEQLAINGVYTNIRSVNPWNILNVLEPQTVTTLGIMVPDGYPDRGITDPQAAAQSHVNSLSEIYNKWNVPIIYGEMGYDVGNPNVTDEQQRAVMAANLAAIETLPYVRGLNYWTGPGYPAPDLHNGTRIFSGTRGAWVLRPAGNELKQFFVRALERFNPYRVEITDLKPLLTSVKNGTRADFSAQAVVPSGLSGTTVKFSISDSSGKIIFNDTQNPVSFSGGEVRTLQGSWPVPKGLVGGTYGVKLEISVTGQPTVSQSTTLQTQ